jgi:regulatory protein
MRWRAHSTGRRRSPGLADPVQDAYVAGLTMLARRELSEAQVRQRLLRRGLAPQDVEAAIARLKSERAIDDVRVAEAIARTEVSLRRRGRLRVDRRIQRAGVAPATARLAVDRIYGELDADAVLAAALDKRLGGRDRVADQKEFQRLYRYLIAQGFESDKVLAELRKRSMPSRSDDSGEHGGHL